MAYINQEHKARIATALKAVMPTGWKYSLSISNHSTLNLTITAAPFELIKAMAPGEWFNPETATEATVNHHWIDRCFTDECVADTFNAINACLNIDNYDNSDSQTDYFDVGHYVSIKIGKYNRPFVCTSAPLPITA